MALTMWLLGRWCVIKCMEEEEEEEEDEIGK
jgi:hypothetical protein